MQIFSSITAQYFQINRSLSRKANNKKISISNTFFTLRIQKLHRMCEKNIRLGSVYKSELIRYKDDFKQIHQPYSCSMVHLHKYISFQDPTHPAPECSKSRLVDHRSASTLQFSGERFHHILEHLINASVCIHLDCFVRVLFQHR